MPSIIVYNLRVFRAIDRALLSMANTNQMNYSSIRIFVVKLGN